MKNRYNLFSAWRISVLFALLFLSRSLVAQIVVATPNGGEILYANSTTAILWTTTGASISAVRVEFSVNNGTSWTTIATAAPNTGSLTWSVPLSISPSCLVRVSSSGNLSVNDVSNGVFSIVMPWQWAKSAGGTGGDGVKGVAVDESGNSYVTGYFSGTANFGTTSATSSGGTDVYVAKANSAGVWQWVIRGGGSFLDEGNAIALDASGNCYVTGSVRSSPSFGSISLTISGLIDLFVAKATSNGVWEWVVGSSASSDEKGLGIAVDPAGNSYITGYFTANGTSTMSFGTHVLSPYPFGASEVIVGKISPSGTWQWAMRAGGATSEQGFAVAFNNGNIYAVGTFDGTTTFGTTTTVSTGSTDIFLGKVIDPGWSLFALSAPNGGEIYNAGDVVTITWTTANLVIPQTGFPHQNFTTLKLR